jgi:hypothetical protein
MTLGHRKEASFCQKKKAIGKKKVIGGENKKT